MKSLSRIAWGCVAVGMVSYGAGNTGAEEKRDPSSAATTRGAELCRCIGDARGDTAVRINKVLDGPVTSAGIEFADQPLEEVVAVLQDDYDIPIQIDKPALDNAGLGLDLPISVSFRNVSLRSALRLMLKQHQLTSVFRDEVLMITTPEEAEAELRVCVYDIRDLITNWEDQAGLEALTRVIMSSVSTDTWEAKGGGATISPLRPGLLVIAQTRACHDEIDELLSVIREMREMSPKRETSPRATDGGESPFEF